jgi:hypothetical protein
MPQHQTTTQRGPAAGRREELAASTRAAYAADWAFFTDWCTAAGHAPLPATADTVIDFLDDNPAPPATWARHLAAIGRTHSANNQPSPARHPAVIDLVRAAAGSPALDPHPRRLPTARLDELLARIPSHGWPAGLHGRRDRLLLVLNAAGLTRSQLHQLRVHQLTVADQALTVHIGDNRDPIQAPSPRRADNCPACIWLRWRHVLELATRYPGNRILRDAFHRTRTTTRRDPHLCRNTAQRATVSTDQSVFIPADQYGYLTRDQPLSTRTITRILSTVTDDKPPQYRFLTPNPALTPDPDPPPTPPTPSLRRTPDQIHAAHQEALARQHRERARLAQLDSMFDNLNQQIDRLAADARRLAGDADGVDQ